MIAYLKYYLNQNGKTPSLDSLPTLDNLKKEYIYYLFKLTDKNVHKTAEILDISPTVLLDKLDRYKIRP
jgi:DNA-binding NtrC family response regulator